MDTLIFLFLRFLVFGGFFMLVALLNPSTRSCEYCTNPKCKGHP